MPKPPAHKLRSCPRSVGSSVSSWRCTMTITRRRTSTCDTASLGLYWS